MYLNLKWFYIQGFFSLSVPTSLLSISCTLLLFINLFFLDKEPYSEAQLCMKPFKFVEIAKMPNSV
jgi:hypothetical protein